MLRKNNEIEIKSCYLYINTLKKEQELLDLYTDYLITSTISTTSTGLSAVLNNKVSHDSFTRLLNGSRYESKQLWNLVKPTVRISEIEDGILVFDDTISHKPYTDENELICWHYDHTKGHSVKGINLLTGLYVGKNEISIPIVFDLITKELDNVTKKTKSETSKNRRMLNCFDQVLKNEVKFKWVITDVWFSSSENMNHIHSKDKDFIMPLKTNRKVALSLEDKENKKFVPIESLKLEPGICKRVYLEKIPFPVTLIKEEYVNKDLSTASLYLVCSDEKVTYQQIITLYQKRWKVEEYHKSLKNNASLSASPTKTVKTQSNHVFMSIVAYCKLEMLKMRNGLNHFALKAQLYTKAMALAIAELRKSAFGVQLTLNFA